MCNVVNAVWWLHAIKQPVLEVSSYQLNIILICMIYLSSIQADSQIVCIVYFLDLSQNISAVVWTRQSLQSVPLLEEVQPASCSASRRGLLAPPRSLSSPGTTATLAVLRSCLPLPPPPEQRRSGCHQLSASYTPGLLLTSSVMQMPQPLSSLACRNTFSLSFHAAKLTIHGLAPFTSPDSSRRTWIKKVMNFCSQQRC